MKQYGVPRRPGLPQESWTGTLIDLDPTTPDELLNLFTVRGDRKGAVLSTITQSSGDVNYVVDDSLPLRLRELEDRFAGIEAGLRLTNERLAVLQAPSSWFTDRVIEMVGWGPNWDDEGAEAISGRAARRARLLAGLTAAVLGEPEPIPSRRGGIHLLWTGSEGRHVTLTVAPDGSIGAATKVVGPDAATVEINSDAEIVDLLRTLLVL